MFVEAAPGNPDERLEGPGVGIEQHLVPLAGIGQKPEGAAGTQGGQLSLGADSAGLNDRTQSFAETKHAPRDEVSARAARLGTL